MKIQRSKKFAAEVSTSSLNDIMFFLLIFFLIISTLANPNVIKIMLPKAGSTNTVNNDKPMRLSITEDRQYYIENEAVLWDELEKRIVTYSNGRKDGTIVLRLASNLNVQDMVDVMSLCNKYKLKMVLATEKINASAAVPAQ